MSTIVLHASLLSGLQLHTENAIKNAERQRRRVQRFKARVFALFSARSIPNLYLLGTDIFKLIDALNSAGVDELGDAELKTTIHEVSQLGGRIKKILREYKEMGIRETPVYQMLFNRIEDGNHHLASIVESLHLAMSPDFVAGIAEAAEELRRACSSGSKRRIVVGQV